MDHQKKNVLVTSGISGIGKGTVMELIKEGYRVIIFARSAEDSEKVLKVLKECRNLGGEACYKQCNLLYPEQIEEGFLWIRENYGSLYGAVNNAGYGIPAKALADCTETEISELLSIDVRVCLLSMTQELKLMCEGGIGRIVNITSGAGLMGSAGNALYCACKHAVVGMTKAAALDYVKQNITVNAIAPGTIETELVASLKDISPETYAMCCASNPIGRPGKPSEIGAAAAFLLREESAFINGVVLPVDSGWAAGK